MRVAIRFNQKNRIYHKVQCPYAKRIKSINYELMEINQAERENYRECKYCGGLAGDVRCRKEQFRTLEENGRITVRYQKNSDTLYMKTENGFWKTYADTYSGNYLLWHKNSFNKSDDFSKMMGGKFHRQTDVKKTPNLDKLLNYIEAHDKAKIIIESDYRKLPKSSKKQKKYYQQAKNRDRRKAERRVDQIFAMLESDNSEMRQYSIG